jgi:hypothetical protein
MARQSNDSLEDLVQEIARGGKVTKAMRRLARRRLIYAPGQGLKRPGSMKK